MRLFTKVCLIREPRVLIPVARKNALGASAVESDSEAAYSTEKVDEFEFVRFCGRTHFITAGEG